MDKRLTLDQVQEISHAAAERVRVAKATRCRGCRYNWLIDFHRPGCSAWTYMQAWIDLREEWYPSGER